MNVSSGRLARRLGLGDAVVVGLSSMIGAGVFVAFAPAAQAAGGWLLAGLALAGLVAWANATSSAQLAATYPTSGGTYVYGRAQLGPWWGFAAGWSFVIGKSASCAAMALAFAAYTVPAAWQAPVAAATMVVLTAVSYRGITRTARLARVVVSVVLVALAVGLLGALIGGAPQMPSLTDDAATPSWYGIAQSAGLLFFAFAGYARIATLGEEVRDPEHTIPRAITLSLGLVVLLYTAVGLTLLATLGAEGTAGSTAPLAEAVGTSSWTWARAVVRVGAAAAALGALLALVAGVSRTVLAMSRERDLPVWLAAVHPRHQVPHRAELLVAGVVVVLVLSMDVRGAIGFSSFGVLLYYAVANAAALTQSGAHRRYPRAMQVFGLLGCLLLAATLPPASVLIGLMVLLAGLLARALALARR